MSNPFNTLAQSEAVASDAQLRLIATLLAQRDWQSIPNEKYVARIAVLQLAIQWAQRPMAETTPPAVSRLINNTLPRKAGDGERLNVIMAHTAAGFTNAEFYGPLTRKGASTLINGLMTLPKRAAEVVRVPAEQIGEQLTTDQLTDGIWVTADGQTIKVQEARNGSGHLYAKLMDENGRFEYVGGLIGKLASQVQHGVAHRMTANEAKAYGALYGRCIECGRTLTDEDSIAAGIGPVCAGKYA